MTDSRLLENAFAAPNSATIFHSPEFFRLHSGDKGIFFEWETGDRIVATIHFTEVKTGTWRSPARGTFAGLAFHADLELASLASFWDCVLTRLVDLGAKEVEIVLAPQAHNPVGFATSVYLLQSSGFEVAQCDLNHTIEMGDQPLAEKMNHGNRKRLRKAERDGFQARRGALAEVSTVYDTIVANRTSKGYSVSMTLDQVQTMIDLFPDRIILFIAAAESEVAASAICIRLNDEILYVLYWGDRPGYSALSPVATLASAIYGYCQEAKIRLLDAGTSTVGCEPNHGLIHFKRGLGFTESLKLTMRKIYTARPSPIA